MDVDTARINGTLGENNLVGKGEGGISKEVPQGLVYFCRDLLHYTIWWGGGGSPQRFSWGQDCITLYNLVGGGGIATEVQLGTGYFCRGV